MDKKLSIQEFVKLPKEERAKRYKDMSDHDKFLWRTQYEIMKGEVTGHVETSEEEQKKSEAEFREFLKKEGIIKD